MTFTYDVLGRKTGRTDDPAVGSNVSYTWTWDTVKQGLLTSQSGNGLTETYAYDIKSRLQTLTTTITGLSGNRVFSYTYDEHLEQVDLIHMNGRVYDPVIGRFLSPDLYVQAPLNNQSFNRYSYVFNNPLSLIDPSGYNSCEATDKNGNPVPCIDLGGGHWSTESDWMSTNSGDAFISSAPSSSGMSNGTMYGGGGPTGATSSMLGDASGYTSISPSGGHPVNTVVGAALMPCLVVVARRRL